MGAVGVCCCWSLELPANAKRQDKPAVFSKAGENPTVYFQPGTGKGVEACKGRVLLKQRPHRLLGLEASGATGERSERSLALRQLTGHTHTHPTLNTHYPKLGIDLKQSQRQPAFLPLHTDLYRRRHLVTQRCGRLFEEKTVMTSI